MTNKPSNAWQRLVFEVGEKKARVEMQRRRKLVKNPGFKGNSEQARKVANLRWSKYAKDNQSEGTEDEV